ncbi:MAG: pilus assembly protein, partial [Microbacteriaceae bacterium]|nr:pilus assembly protein [Microbacteriaceae bacterium]
MFNVMRTKAAARARTLFAVRAVRRLVRRQDGSAAVEFGMVAMPFLMLVFAIMETAIVFFAGQTL